ncbi:hypothetical protein SAY86_018535 [Trapa natans]|uniref:DNA-directed RNA polymerase III subunit RPC3 n=1 Tax=Trapa natans TaxID=22666 RepID=A0AAN7LCX5_TRANT|nr:hypothetical protein SAY86_018535 [Trapa natans]
MTTQWSIKYAVHVISSYFGDLAARVCGCTLRRGPLSKQNIVRFSETPIKQVNICLLLLIQQNIVQAFIVEDPDGTDDAAKQTTLYLVLFDNIIQRTRFPKFMIVVSQELDKTETSYGEDTVRKNLARIVHAHFVERCPALEPLLVLPCEEELAAKKRSRSTKVQQLQWRLRDEMTVDSEMADDATDNVGEKVESIVLKRYCPDSHRIFRLLSKADDLLETNNISKMVFVDQKETPNILYKLWKDKYLHMEKVTFVGRQQCEFLLWKVNKPTLWKSISGEMYYASLSVSFRVVHEMEQASDASKKCRSNSRHLFSCSSTSSSSHSIMCYGVLLLLPWFLAAFKSPSKEEGRAFAGKVKRVLEESLINLDDAIMLFHDF